MKSGRSNSYTKNNDLSRFSKYSMFTADLFHIYFAIRSRTSAKYQNNLGELLTNTNETFFFSKELRWADQSTCSLKSQYFLISIKTSIVQNTTTAPNL